MTWRDILRAILGLLPAFETEESDRDEEVYLELLQGFSDAISYNRTAVSESERYLFVTQLLLISSIVSGSVALIVL